MNTLITSRIGAAALAILGLAAPALATDKQDERADWKANGEIVILERNDEGKATRVRVDGKEIDVCMTQEQDNCINPRAAGLNWGDYPLMSYPDGKNTDDD